MFPCEPDSCPIKPCTGLSGISEDLSLSPCSPGVRTPANVAQLSPLVPVLVQM